MSQHNNEPTSDEVLLQFSYKKLLIPLIIGIAAVAFFFFRDFDAEKLKAIDWNSGSLFWFSIAALAMVVRHFCLMYRIRLLSNKVLNWQQAFELVSLWEFSSAVTPSTVGGTATSLYFLTKEGISAGKTTTIILVTVFLDGLFFTLAVCVLWLILGNNFISTDIDIAETLLNGDTSIVGQGPSGWAYAFFVGFGLNIFYFVLVAYGLFVNPKSIQWFIVQLFKLPFIRRWKDVGEKAGADLLVASKGLKNQSWEYWIGSFISTAGAWIIRLAIVNFVVLAVVYYGNQLMIFGRSLILYLVMVLGITPGSSGVAEFTFITIYRDFLQDGIAPAMALIWRIFTFYIFFPLGFIVLPRWIRRVYAKKVTVSN